MSLANIGPNRFHPKSSVSWQKPIPRSNRRSSTFRKDNGKRAYNFTTRRITSDHELKRRNGLGGRPLDLRDMAQFYLGNRSSATLV